MKIKPLLVPMAVFGCLFADINSALAQTWTQTSAPITNWNCIASSADGRKLVAGVWGGGIYASTNSGVTWTPTTAPTAFWSSVASSADGTKLVAAGCCNEPIYASTNSGATWTQTSAPTEYLQSVASSADGNTLVAASGGPWVYTSTNSGATWTSNMLSRSISVVASSADGTKLVGGGGTLGVVGPIVASTNSGATWTITSAPFDWWYSVALSADGSCLIASSQHAFNVYTWTDSVLTARPVGSFGGSRKVISSADGRKLVATGYGPIFTSADSGNTWISNNAPVANWRSAASSADGNKLVAVVDGGGIWTSQSTARPVLNIAPASTHFVLSWIVPSLDFKLQENSDLATTNWTDVTSTLTLNLTNLQNQVTVPLPAGHRFYRLKY